MRNSSSSISEFHIITVYLCPDQSATARMMLSEQFSLSILKKVEKAFSARSTKSRQVYLDLMRESWEGDDAPVPETEWEARAGREGGPGNGGDGGTSRPTSRGGA